MTNEKPGIALYHKMFAEQEKYRAWMLSQPPDEILNHAYGYTTREDILLSLEYNDLPNKQTIALLKSPCLLADVFKDFHTNSDFELVLKARNRSYVRHLEYGGEPRKCND